MEDQIYETRQYVKQLEETKTFFKHNSKVVNIVNHKIQHAVKRFKSFEMTKDKYPQAIEEARHVRNIVRKTIKWRDDTRFVYDYYRTCVDKLSNNDLSAKAEKLR